MDISSGLESVTFTSSTTYTIIEELGRGGMGIVFLAEKNSGGVLDYVVLKSIKSIDETQVQRLRQEANVATMLRHENIVKTYGLETIPLSGLPAEFRTALEGGRGGAAPRGAPRTKEFRRRQLQAYHGARSKGRGPTLKGGAREDEPRLFLMAMDYIDGADMDNIHRAHLERGLLMPVPLAAFVISRICRALHYAHAMIVHRDVTPENILVNNQGVAKLTDFGIAVATDAAGQQFAGKLHYMSPEQINRQDVDPRTDIFALGLCAYHIVTGISLLNLKAGLGFQEQVEFVKRQMAQPLLPPHQVRADVPRALSDIIMKMLARDPAKRYQDMGTASVEFEGKYLYAAGFGPTNNSLMAYLEIFENGFQKYDENQLRNLAFLKNEEGKIKLKRRLAWDLYSREAKKTILSHQGTNSYIYRAIAKLSAGQKKSG